MIHSRNLIIQPHGSLYLMVETRFNDCNSLNLIVMFNSFLYLILGWFDSLIVFSNRIVRSNGGN